MAAGPARSQKPPLRGLFLLVLLSRAVKIPVNRESTREIQSREKERERGTRRLVPSLRLQGQHQRSNVLVPRPPTGVGFKRCCCSSAPDEPGRNSAAFEVRH